MYVNISPPFSERPNSPEKSTGQPSSQKQPTSTNSIPKANAAGSPIRTIAALQNVPPPDPRLIEEEKVEVGSIPISTYLIYIRYAGGYIVGLFVCTVFVVNIGSTAFSSWWLAHWLNNGVAVSGVNLTRLYLFGIKST